jgi:hypothetical protein
MLPTTYLSVIVYHDVQVVEHDTRVAEIHANSETFDSKAEASFKYLQV